MLKRIKIQDNRKVFICSDFHIDHERDFIWDKRGFSSCAEHKEAIIEKTNNQVAANDILINIGDMFLNSTAERVNNFLSRINCQNIYYLWGNHESVLTHIYSQEVKKIADVEEIYPLHYMNLTFLGNYMEFSIRKKIFCVGHFAQRLWNKSHHGTYFLCGHSHGSDPGTSFGDNLPKIFDCGVENALAYSNREYVCFPVEDVIEILEKRKVQILDHHDN